MKRHRFFPIVLATLLLAACQSTPTPTATALPPETTAPTVAPAASPTTALASATPLSTPLQSAPTQSSRGLRGSTTATLAPTAIPNQGASASACDSPYYPVKVGAKWVYHITYSAGGLPPADYLLTDPHLSAKGFTEQRVSAGVSVDNRWTCASQGLLSTQAAGLFMAAPARFKFTTLKSSGVTFPPSNQWKIGTTWSTGYDVKGTLVLMQANTTATTQGTETYANTIAKQESVTVPAGAFTALRVDSTVTMALAATLSGNRVPINNSFKVSSWYARNVGMVKSVAREEGMNATTKLASFTP